MDNLIFPFTLMVDTNNMQIIGKISGYNEAMYIEFLDKINLNQAPQFGIQESNGIVFTNRAYAYEEVAEVAELPKQINYNVQYGVFDIVNGFLMTQRLDYVSNTPYLGIATHSAMAGEKVKVKINGVVYEGDVGALSQSGKTLKPGSIYYIQDQLGTTPSAGVVGLPFVTHSGFEQSEVANGLAIHKNKVLYTPINNRYYT